jgi:hypothetical protein
MNAVVTVQFVQIPYQVYYDVTVATETLANALIDLANTIEDRGSFRKKERKVILECCKQAIQFARTAEYNGQYRVLIAHFSRCSHPFYSQRWMSSTGASRPVVGI